MTNDMLFCPVCGTKLYDKFLEHEGMIPYCDKCQKYVFPHFSTAVSMVILNKERTHTLFVKQYGTGNYRLVAGYINKGEAAEETVKREMKEEIGIEPIEITFNKTAYFEKTNTLMINFIVIVDTMDIIPNYEIDSYSWFTLSDGVENINHPSLAEEFYLNFYNHKKC